MTAKSRKRKQLKKVDNTHQVITPIEQDGKRLYKRDICTCPVGEHHFLKENE